MEAAIHSVSLGTKGQSSWTLVVYNTTNGVEVSEVATACNVSGARTTRIITVCSIARSEGTFVSMYTSTCSQMT